MALILCIETSTTNCSVAVSSNGNILALREDNSKSYSHAERLHLYVREVLKDAGITKEELKAVAVSKGPGSYTGLRIGVSAAKGLCFSLDLPLISIPTLDSLAVQVSGSSGTIIPMLDARRMEVYSAVYTGDHRKLRETQAQILDENSFTEYLDAGPVYFIGNANDKFKNICGHNSAHFIDSLPSAGEMTQASYEAYLSAKFEDVAYFEPFYLKDFLGA